jgi:hypothetical protein
VLSNVHGSFRRARWCVEIASGSTDSGSPVSSAISKIRRVTNLALPGGFHAQDERRSQRTLGLAAARVGDALLVGRWRDNLVRLHGTSEPVLWLRQITAAALCYYALGAGLRRDARTPGAAARRGQGEPGLRSRLAAARSPRKTGSECRVRRAKS